MKSDAGKEKVCNSMQQELIYRKKRKKKLVNRDVCGSIHAARPILTWRTGDSLRTKYRFVLGIYSVDSSIENRFPVKKAVENDIYVK